MTKKTLESAIRACVNRKDKAFVPYIMAGDGGIGALKEQILFLQEAGVTAIELGIPFSDPVADGPVIQEAGGRALAQGVTLRKVLEELRVFRNEVTGSNRFHDILESDFKLWDYRIRRRLRNERCQRIDHSGYAA